MTTEIKIPLCWDGVTALSVVHLLEQLIQAVWQVHGEQMAHELQPAWLESGLVHGDEPDNPDPDDLDLYEEIPF